MAIPDKLWCFGCSRLVESKADDTDTKVRNKDKGFYKNYNEYHIKYNHSRMNFCKKCCREIGNDMRKKQENFQLFTISLCNFFDLPYDSRAMIEFKQKVDNARKDGADFNYVWNYQECLKTLNFTKEHWNNLSANNNFLHIDLLKIASPTTSGDMDIFYEWEKYWGKQPLLEDYIRLDEAFYEYTSNEELNPFTEKSFRRLCLIELDLRKAREKNSDYTERNRISSELTKLGAKLGVDKFVSVKEKNSIVLHLEEYNAMEENTRPIDVAEKKFAEDICGLKKGYMEMMRTIGNATGNTENFPNEFLGDLKRGDD